MAKRSEQEFNPVKMSNEEFLKSSAKEFLKSFVEYFASDERQPHECIDTFLNHWEDTRSQPEEPKVKTTAAFDNSRLEFLRMTTGPVQNFYQTLGNILYSLSIRLDVAEAKIESLNKYIGGQSETRTDKD